MVLSTRPGEASSSKEEDFFFPRDSTDIKEKGSEKFGLDKEETDVENEKRVFGVQCLWLRDREEEDIYSIFSTMEEFEDEGKTDFEVTGDEKENLKENQDLMVVENDLTIDTFHDPEIEEIIQLSLEGINISSREVKYCSQWIINKVNKFSKKMGVSLEGMEDFSYFFFSEIEIRKMLVGKAEPALTERRKVSCGTPRMLKRLESTINYDGRRKEGKKAGGSKMCSE